MKFYGFAEFFICCLAKRGHGHIFVFCSAPSILRIAGDHRAFDNTMARVIEATSHLCQLHFSSPSQYDKWPWGLGW